MKKLELKNVLWKEDKYYVAQCLNVDISSFGRIKTEAIKNTKEARELYFEDIKFPKIKKVSNPVIVSEELQYA